MKRLLIALGVALLAVLTARAALLMEGGLDYFADASDAVDALVRLDWDGFAAGQPLMGSFSLLLRAPFAAVVFTSDIETVFLAGAIPCVLATVALGVVLGRIAADAGHGAVVQGLVAGLAVLNPITFRALHWGHPEELLGAALCVGAVLAVLRGRDVLGAVLLGLALATKQWAVLAVVPVLLAGPRRPLLVAGIAGGLAAALTLPLLVADPARFGAVAQSVSAQVDAAASTTPWNVWWPLAALGAFGEAPDRYFAPAWVPTVSRPLIVLLAVPLALAVRRRTDRRADDALLLLAVLFLARCVLDNWNNEYYHAPFLLSLLAWEAVRRPGVPVLTLASAVLLGVTFWPQHDAMFSDPVAGAGVAFALYVAWAVPLLLWLGTLAARPAALPRALRLGASDPPPRTNGRSVSPVRPPARVPVPR